ITTASFFCTKLWKKGVFMQIRPARFRALAVVAFWFCLENGFAAEPQTQTTTRQMPKRYLCYCIDRPLAIDGRLDKPAWKSVPWSEDFMDIEGDAKPKPRFRTRVKMLWDDNYFYISAELEEPHVWATLTQHDSVIFQDNDFEVFIDPDGDTLNYYEFEMN